MKHRQTLTTTKPRQTGTAAAFVAPTPANESPSVPVLEPRERTSCHERIATEAYFLAQRRGFAPGSELDDWLAAEMAVTAPGRPVQADG